VKLNGEVVHDTVPGVTITVIDTGSPTFRLPVPEVEVTVPLKQYCWATRPGAQPKRAMSGEQANRNTLVSCKMSLNGGLDSHTR
jgi:hypothetical protein